MSVHSSQIITSADRVNLVRHAEAIDVGADTETTILTYTATQDLNISKVSCSGDAYAKFKIYINTVLTEVKRSGPARNIDFKFDAPLTLSQNDILDIKVIHYVTGDTLNFETTLYGFTE